MEHISADIISDEQRNGESLDRIRVSTDNAHIKGPDGPLPVIPGMVASVEILTGHKSVLDYLLKPVLKTGEVALRER